MIKVKEMNKTEFEDIDYHTKYVETSDDGNEILESLYSDIKAMYRVLRYYRDKNNRKPII